MAINHVDGFCIFSYSIKNLTYMNCNAIPFLSSYSPNIPTDAVLFSVEILEVFIEGQ